MKYAFIAQKLSGYPLSVACETLDISPGGHHAWRTRPQAYRTLQNQELSRKIKEIFLASGKSYGARRIVAELRELHGYTGSLNRIKQLMRLAGLRPKARRKFKATTDSNLINYRLHRTCWNRNFGLNNRIKYGCLTSPISGRKQAGFTYVVCSIYSTVKS